MNIQLTPQQQQALDTQEDGPLRVIDHPRTNTSYILVREVDYTSMRRSVRRSGGQGQRRSGGGQRSRSGSPISRLVK